MKFIHHGAPFTALTARREDRCLGLTAKRLPAGSIFSWVLLGLLALSSSGCATFRGPGKLTMAGAENSPSSQQTSILVPANSFSSSFSPQLRLEGDRRFDADNSTIQLDWPVDEARFSRGFIAAAARRKRPHWGIDLANTKGTPILASEGGTVIYAGREFKGYGRLIVIEHNDEWATLYSHLDKITVEEGQIVKKGQEIGKMGRTGRATGVHLHFEVRHHRQPVNPLAYLPQNGSTNIAAELAPDLNPPPKRNTRVARRSDP